MSSPSPIILFAYNRPFHTRKALVSLAKNRLASESKLYIYCDAPNPKATEEDLKNIDRVAKVVREQQWCGTVEIIENKENLGIDYQTPLRIGEVLKEHDTVIVLEDDCVLSKGFLKYMNDALSIYKNEELLMHIGGWIPPVKGKLPDTYFMRGVNHNTGWATWRRAWVHYNSNIPELIDLIEATNPIHFNLDGAFNSLGYLKEVAKKEKRKQNWDIIWLASVYTSGGYSILPGKSLVNNIGFDGSGTHCDPETEKILSHSSIANKIPVVKKKVQEDTLSRKIMASFWLNRYKPTFRDKLRDKLKYEWKKLFGSSKD